MRILKGSSLLDKWPVSPVRVPKTFSFPTFNDLPIDFWLGCLLNIGKWYIDPFPLILVADDDSSQS